MMAKVRDSLDEVKINNLLETKGSINEADVQSLLDDWVRARRNVWDTLFGVVNASTPDPWKHMMECTTGQYRQMVASMLEGQAAAMSTMLRAFGPANSLAQAAMAGGEGLRRTVETTAQTQPKTGEASSKGLTGQSLLGTERASTNTASEDNWRHRIKVSTMTKSKYRLDLFSVYSPCTRCTLRRCRRRTFRRDDVFRFVLMLIPGPVRCHRVIPS